MEELLAPEKLLTDYKNKKISKEELEISLISLIENSDDNFIIMRTIGIVDEFSLDSENIFNILETCLISNQFFKVCEAAAKVLLRSFPRKCTDPIVWGIHHNKFSPTCFAQLCDYVIFSEDQTYPLDELRKKLINILDISIQKYVKKGVIPQESILLAILERQYFNYTNDPDGNYNNQSLIKGNLEFIQKQKSFQYRINKNGNVIEIYLGEHDNLDIRVILTHIYYFQKLEMLTLRYCRILTVPESIGMIKSLKYLNLARNYIEKLPDSIGSLQFLENLDLSENLISEIPNSIGSLKNLTYLNIKRNKINVLPEQINNLKKLKTLESDLEKLE